MLCKQNMWKYVVRNSSAALMWSLCYMCCETHSHVVVRMCVGEDLSAGCQIAGRDVQINLWSNQKKKKKEETELKTALWQQILQCSVAQGGKNLSTDKANLDLRWGFVKLLFFLKVWRRHLLNTSWIHFVNLWLWFEGWVYPKNQRHSSFCSVVSRTVAQWLKGTWLQARWHLPDIIVQKQK